ncbi:MAG: glutamate mutase L [Candidatus Riflebacteria bacterium]|nr:glutamate mutase L [Candidatus Riflebacteria bacterium]
MIEDRVICVDIGSTWTKGAVFKLSHDRFSLERRAAMATTTDYLPDGFYAVLRHLQPDCNWHNTESSPLPVYFSSSAKGGLSVAVVGLVPEMTLQIARLAAFSAGARITAAYSYRLTRNCIAAIEKSRPDILLLCGGTDGGNERYVTENARVLASSDYDGTIIYAGNNMAVDQIRDLLDSRDLRISENLMPDFGQLNIEPVREAIKSVFLERIVSGKGLDQLIRQFDTQPLPTPLAMINLVDAIGKNIADWQNFALIDMGGATTDFYSFAEAYYADSGTIMKGIVEPRLKRTVEGDLGMRVSAESAFETARDLLLASLEGSQQSLESLRAYTEKLVANTSHLPADLAEQSYDQLLASACIFHAVMRHAGIIEQIYTAKGPVWAQSGKDLRRINRIVGTGGFLAAMGRAGDAIELPFSPQPDVEKIPLLPVNFEYYADPDYILPLLGSLAEKYPRQSAAAAVSYLTRLHPNEEEVKEFSHSEFTDA